MTVATTLAAIRTNMVTRIRALVPTLVVRNRFEPEQGDAPFRLWAESNRAAAFRKFSLLEEGEEDPPTVSDLDVEMRTATLVLLVAYPKTWALYGKENIRSAQTLIEADRRLIEGRSGIGHTALAGFVAGQCGASLKNSIETGEAVLFARSLVTVTYYRSVSA